MSAPLGPSSNILFIVKTVHWKRKDTMLSIVLHNRIQMKKLHHPKTFQQFSFGKELVMN